MNERKFLIGDVIEVDKDYEWDDKGDRYEIYNIEYDLEKRRSKYFLRCLDTGSKIITPIEYIKDYKVVR